MVAIAIPTLEAGAPLAACLRSLNAQVFREFEVTVINNGTRACSAPPDLFFPCRFLFPGENVGFGAAVNMVARTTTAPFIATLNDDTEPDPEWLDALVREISTNPRIGMCASRIRLFESGKLDSAGMLICLDGSSKQRGRGEPATTFDCPEEVLLPSGCAALYRRQMLEEVGFFDEDYFLYCEDTDPRAARPLGRMGLPLCSGRNAAASLFSHRGEHFLPSRLRFVRHRNRQWVAVKNFPMALLALSPLISILRYSWQFAAVGAGRGAAFEYVRSGNSLRSALAILAGAHGETLRLLPSLLRKRAAIRRTRRIGSLTFLKLLFRHRITARELARS